MEFLDYWNRSGVQYFTIQVSYMGRYSPYTFRSSGGDTVLTNCHDDPT